jgi:dCTP deaminase
MILSDKDILDAIREGEIKITPLVQEHIQPASVDLTLAPTIRRFNTPNTRIVDVTSKQDLTQVVDVGEDGIILIRPGDFILGSTTERVCLPSYLIARIDGRSSLARLGLIVQAAASYAAPGFSGHLTLEMINLSKYTLKLHAGMRIAQVYFEVLSSSVIHPYGSPELGSKYQNQTKPTASRIWKEFEKR